MKISKRRKKTGRKNQDCYYYVCNKHGVKLYKCNHCGKYFCKNHLTPTIPSLISKSLSAHPCPYYRIWLKDKEKENVVKRLKKYEDIKITKPLTETPHERDNFEERLRKTWETKYTPDDEKYSDKDNKHEDDEKYSDKDNKHENNNFGITRKLIRDKLNTVLGYIPVWAIRLIMSYLIVNYLVFSGAMLDISRASTEVIESVANLLTKISIAPTRNETIIEQTVYEMTNELRIKAGVSPLKCNYELANLAKEHSKDMLINNYLSHTNKEGLSPTDRAIKNVINVVKYYGTYYQTGIGENIIDMPITFIPLWVQVEGCFIVLTNEQIAECSMDSWKGSLGHYSNIINPSYDEIGVGAYCNFFGCKLTQDFR